MFWCYLGSGIYLYILISGIDCTLAEHGTLAFRIHNVSLVQSARGGLDAHNALY